MLLIDHQKVAAPPVRNATRAQLFLLDEPATHVPDGAIGAMLIAGANRRAANPEAQLLAAGSAAGIAAIDVTYVMKRRIAPVYLLDALGEVALLTLGWARYKRRKNSDAGTGKNV